MVTVSAPAEALRPKLDEHLSTFAGYVASTARSNAKALAVYRMWCTASALFIDCPCGFIDTWVICPDGL